MQALRPSLPMVTFIQRKIVVVQLLDPQTQVVVHEFSHPYEMEISASNVKEEKFSASKDLSRAEATAIAMAETIALYKEGLSPKEISEKLKVTVDCIYLRINKLKKQKRLPQLGKENKPIGGTFLNRFLDLTEIKSIAAADTISEAARNQKETPGAVYQRLGALGKKMGHPKFTARQTFNFIKKQIDKDFPLPDVFPIAKLGDADTQTLRAAAGK